MRTLLATAAILVAMLNLSCIGLNCLTGAGPVVKRTKEVQTFRGIVLQGSLDVQVKQGGAQLVEVEGQQNLVDLVEFVVKDGICTIRTQTCYRTDKPFVVHVTVPGLERVSIQGSGDVKGTGKLTTSAMDLDIQGSGDLELDLTATDVNADVQGSGTLKLTGSCTTLDASVQGSGDVKAGNLIAGSAQAHVTGSGDITVQTTGTLDARVVGSGDIRYRGTPSEIKRSITGSGDVKPVKD